MNNLNAFGVLVLLAGLVLLGVGIGMLTRAGAACYAGAVCIFLGYALMNAKDEEARRDADK